MPGTPTPNLGLVVPTVGSDINIWGNELNGDLAILDTLAVAPAINVASSYAVVTVNAMEEVIRVTTGSLAITITLPPAPTLAGKFVTLFKVDAGVGSFSIVGLINGYAYWQISNQFGYVRLFGNGASYDVVGSG